MRSNKQYRIVKATDAKLVGVIFEYVIINNVVAPKWFSEFVDKQFKPLAEKVASIETRLEKVESILESVIKFNNLKTE